MGQTPNNTSYQRMKGSDGWSPAIIPTVTMLIALVACPKVKSTETQPDPSQGIETTRMSPPVEGKNESATPKVPSIQTADAIRQHAGQTVAVHGTYVEVDIRKNASPPSVYQGHAAIELGDGTRVMLGSYWEDSSIQSQSNREDLGGEEVVAEGIIMEVCPPNPAGATMEIPCLFPLLFVVTPDVYQLLKAL